MTIKEIIDNANNLSDEKIPTETIKHWVSSAVSKFNLYWPALVPPLDLSNLDAKVRLTTLIPDLPTTTPPNTAAIQANKLKQAQFASVNRILVDRLIVKYVAFQIKVNDGSAFEYNDMMSEWKADLIQSKALYDFFIDPLYKFQAVKIGNENQFDSPKVALPSQDDFVYSDKNTFGEDPGAGVGAAYSGVSSTNKYGGK